MNNFSLNCNRRVTSFVSVTLFILSVLTVQILKAQNWATVDQGFDREVRCFYADSASNKLYAGGKFWTANNNNLVVNGISVLENGRWDTLSQGTNLCSFSGCNPVLSIEKFNNEIYAAGFFYGMQNVPNTRRIAKWNGANWQSIGNVNGFLFDLTVYNNELYAVGNFDSIDGVLAYSIAAYDGTSWRAVADTLFKNRTLNGATTFQNSLVVGGSFYNATQGSHCIAQFDGTSWMNVGAPVFLNVGGGIQSMLEYQNQLYVAGSFSASAGAPGDGIVRWDGNTWTDVGGGITDTLGFPASILDMCIWNNKLVVGGDFTYSGGVHTSNLSQWDGVSWCSFGSQIYGTLYAVENLNDTLYIGGDFFWIDSDSLLPKVAKWTGGSFVDTCGSSTGFSDNVFFQYPVAVYPNPASEFVTFQFLGTNETRTIILYDQIGREVWRKESDQMMVEFATASFADGAYLYVVSNDNGTVANGKILIMH